MRFKKTLVAVAVGMMFIAIPSLGLADGSQGELPVDIDGPQEERVAVNSFGRGTVLRAIHNESVPTPPTDVDSVLDTSNVSPDIIPNPHIRRYYITCYYYGCRPWFIHPYTGATLKPWDIISSVDSTNPHFRLCAQGKTTQQLMSEVDPNTGEILVQVFDDGLVSEDNDAIQIGSELEQLAEIENAAALNVNLGGRIWPIWHQPYYGLYCMRVRICIPILSSDVAGVPHPQPGVRHRIWCRFPFKWHQPVCWRRWWFHRWCPPRSIVRPDGTTITLPWRIWPWRPMCMPNFLWTRSGPDWVCNLTSVNLYRSWCLYGVRYAFLKPSSNPFVLTQFPYVGDLDASLDQRFEWRRPWPYPRVRYYPFRPYCGRWFWFRCLPWITYRHFPPILHAAIAAPKPEHGGGFIPLPADIQKNVDDPALNIFSQDPPNLADGAFLSAPGGPTSTAPDSFFDIFIDAGECRYRPVEERIGDNDGDGAVSRSKDQPKRLRAESLLPVNQDTTAEDFNPAFQQP